MSIEPTRLKMFTFTEDFDRTEFDRVLNEYQQAYNSVSGNNESVTDGTSWNLDAAGFIFYEGFDVVIGSDLCDQAIPLVVLNVLSHSHQCVLGQVKCGDHVEYGVKHPRVNYYITETDLRSGKYIDQDEICDEEGPPEYFEAQVALYSFEICRQVINQTTRTIKESKPFVIRKRPP